MAHSATIAVHDNTLSVMCDQCLAELNNPPAVAIGSAWLEEELRKHFRKCKGHP